MHSLGDARVMKTVENESEGVIGELSVNRTFIDSILTKAKKQLTDNVAFKVMGGER